MPWWPTRVRISETASTASACAGTCSSSQRRVVKAVSATADRLFAAANRVLDPVEHAAVVVLRGRALEFAQTLVQRLLILAQRSRHGDVEEHELVAAPAGAVTRHALPTNADHLPVLR